MKFRLSIIFYILIFSLLLIPKISYSDVIISVPDTLIPRGEIYQIPIKGTINDIECKTIKITIVYNAFIVKVNNAFGSDSYAMKCSTPNIVYNYIDLNNAKVEIYCDNVQNIEDGIICTIGFQGLAGPDTVTTVSPEKILINSQEPLNIKYSNGHITVPGIPVFQRFPQGLGQNYPNPFNYQTNFPFSIDNSSKVEFKMFYMSGKRMLETNVDNASFRILKITGTGVSVIDDQTAELEKGKYVLEITPEHNLPSGVYFLLMKVGESVYNRSFMFVK